MRTDLSSLAFLAAVASLAEASVRATTHRRTDISDPIEHDRRRHGVLSERALAKRQDDTVTASLTNGITLYYINASIGTPSKDFLLHIDTGSSDLWVNTATSSLCEENARLCAAGGTYSSSSSSSYKFINNFFNVSYADGSGASGPYVSDTVVIGDTTLQDFQFGIGTTSSSIEGILGIGYSTNEGVVQTSTSLIYPNLPLALARAGDIERAAYSLYLNDLDASTGTILFGGIDTDKFSDPLVTVPVLSSDGVYSQFLVAMTGLGINGNAGSLVSDQSLAVLLDSGTSLTYLPESVTNALYEEYETSYDSRAGYATVSCSLADQSGSVDFTFSGLTVSVGLDELVINISNDPTASECAFGVAPSTGLNFGILGDTFLRSAYVVYDIANNEISIAQTKFDATSDNVVEIPSGTSDIPSATPASTTATAIGAGITGAVTTVPTSVGSSGGTSNAAPLATAAPVWSYGSGLALGAAALALL